MILDEVKAGALTALIARSADFYGPGVKKTSVLTETVFNNLAKGKKHFGSVGPMSNILLPIPLMRAKQRLFSEIPQMLIIRFGIYPLPLTPLQVNNG
ncbi:MAG: hypothetical protein WD426_01460 [Anditalea sp.]